MKNELKNILKTPLMGKVYALDNYLYSVSILPNKRIQRLVVEPMLHQVGILHQQAIRELRGLDYYKRMNDTIIEIQAAAFRVYQKKGWTLKVASVIDAYCDKIIEDLNVRKFSNSAKSIKSKDEDSSINVL